VSAPTVDFSLARNARADESREDLGSFITEWGDNDRRNGQRRNPANGPGKRINPVPLAKVAALEERLGDRLAKPASKSWLFLNALDG